MTATIKFNCSIWLNYIFKGSIDGSTHHLFVFLFYHLWPSLYHTMNITQIGIGSVLYSLIALYNIWLLIIILNLVVPLL